mmetsp:Transcript_79801/g.222143  ORF Transcript_79801/g.222143 Transcript_79801/m.222143 type:complete len:250 (-) Transcript_79801:446-1195(-)
MQEIGRAPPRKLFHRDLQGRTAGARRQRVPPQHLTAIGIQLHAHGLSRLESELFASRVRRLERDHHHIGSLRAFAKDDKIAETSPRVTARLNPSTAARVALPRRRAQCRSWGFQPPEAKLAKDAIHADPWVDAVELGCTVLTRSVHELVLTSWVKVQVQCHVVHPPLEDCPAIPWSRMPRHFLERQFCAFRQLCALVCSHHLHELQLAPASLLELPIASTSGGWPQEASATRPGRNIDLPPRREWPRWL